MGTDSDSFSGGDSPASSGGAFDSVEPWRLVVSVLLVAVAADWLLYDTTSPGLALSIFALVLGGAVLANRQGWRRDRGLWFAAPVALLAVAQATVAFSWINVLVLFFLLTALAGTRFELPWSQRWPAWLEVLAAWVKAPGRWHWAVVRVHSEWKGSGSRVKWARAGKIALPGLVLLLLFGALLGSGNALAGKYFGQALSAIEENLRALTEISPFRMAFWIAMATAALVLCYPAKCRSFLRAFTGDWRRVALSVDGSIALWQTWISLGVLNALFLFVNTLDVLYLWMRAELPAGVGYSAFVHEGVYALIASTVLSGVVLSFFFQQPADIARSKLARALAIAWIVQNLLLLSGVAVRLHLYIDAFGWSVLRFHVASFLALTAAGFVLLTVYIWRKRSLRWLVLANLVAVFCLFYLLQFCNVSGWVARWNVERWLAGEGPPLDVSYLESLGPPAWPALVRASGEGLGPEAHHARAAVASARTGLETDRLARTWRSWQWRQSRLDEKLISHQEPVLSPEENRVSISTTLSK